jgi:hypothetical protein
MTPEERASFDRWAVKNGVRFWFSDQDRRRILSESKTTTCSVITCMERLNKVKQQAEQQGGIEPVIVFFESLREYTKQEGKTEIEIAKAEEEAERIYRLWFKHFDAWYDEFCRSDGTPVASCPASCPDDCPQHEQLELFPREVPESDYAF